MITREERAEEARRETEIHYSSNQQGFLDFVLSQYIKVGVEELAQDKLPPLLKLRYHDALSDAVTDLGQLEEIGRIFSGFQKFLYERIVEV